MMNRVSPCHSAARSTRTRTRARAAYSTACARERAHTTPYIPTHSASKTAAGVSGGNDDLTRESTSFCARFESRFATVERSARSTASIARFATPISDFAAFECSLGLDASESNIRTHDDDGNAYYFNADTGETSWTPPDADG